MANNYLAILADIKSNMETLADIGFVHDYERQTANAAQFIALFKDAAGRINGWEITRSSAREHSNGTYFRHHQFKLKGYRGLQDATGSSKLFQEQCEEVCAVFRTADSTPPEAPWSYANSDNPLASPAQIDLINDRMFAGILCHCAEISLSVTERITP